MCPTKSETKVTIGMCIKNSEETIKEAINSVLNQDFPHELIELIIVDGQSIDRTLEIIRSSVRETSISVKFFFENEGLGRARQIVVDNARSEYIVWVDGDMILSRDFLRKQFEFMEQHTKVGIAKGKYGILRSLENKSLVAFLEDVGFIHNTFYEGEANQKILGTSGCIYRVKAIKQVGGFDPSIKGVGEDMDAESKMRDFGWKLHISSATFQEIRRGSWSSLWNEYMWHGYGASFLFEKNRRAARLRSMFPPIVLFREMLRVAAVFKFTHRKAVLFLPYHYLLKRVAWSFGFVRGTIERKSKSME